MGRGTGRLLMQDIDCKSTILFSAEWGLFHVGEVKPRVGYAAVEMLRMSRERRLAVRVWTPGNQASCRTQGQSPTLQPADT